MADMRMASSSSGSLNRGPFVVLQVGVDLPHDHVPHLLYPLHELIPGEVVDRIEGCDVITEFGGLGIEARRSVSESRYPPLSMSSSVSRNILLYSDRFLPQGTTESRVNMGLHKASRNKSVLFPQGLFFIGMLTASMRSSPLSGGKYLRVRIGPA